MEIKDVVTPWEEPIDLIDRKKYADFLTAYLANKDSSFVLNLNANWGMGKTYFLSNWCKAIECTYPTVYVNAWESDFSDDPLLAVMASIHTQLTHALPEREQTVQKFAEKMKSGGRFLRGLAPIVTKGLVNKALGDEQAEEATNLLCISTGDVANLAEKTMGMMLEDHVNTMKSAEDFKIALGNFVESVTQKGLIKPLFLFIDELDRCRPTYAIELLEMVKHLFSVDNVIFVIATDSDQLQHSIRAIYGNDFDGAEYLRRFFNQEYKLPTPNYMNYCQVLANEFSFSEKLEYSNFQPWCRNGDIPQNRGDWTAQNSLAIFLSVFSLHFGISLRSIKQVITRLEAILDSSAHQWDGVFLILLLIIQVKDRNLVSWLRKHSDIGDMHTIDNDKYLRGKVSEKSETIRWFYGGRYGGRHSDEFVSVIQILRSYTVAMGTINSTDSDEKLREIGASQVAGLESFIKSNLAFKKVNVRPQYYDLFAYFDHIDMAGALS